MYIIVTSKFNATGDRLTKAFINAGHSARQVRNYSGRTITSKVDDIIINWGCNIELNVSNGTILNNKIIGKELQYKRLLKNDIPIPEVWKSWQHAVDHLPVLYRNPHGFGGRDIALIEYDDYFKHNDAMEGWIFTKYIPKIMELRLHVCGEKLIGMSKKIPQNINDVTWNNHTGAKQDTYRNATTQLFMEKLGVDAVKAVGYDFGAVDVILDRYGRPYVLEVNSAPALISNEDRINGWVDAFVNMNDNLQGF